MMVLWGHQQHNCNHSPGEVLPIQSHHWPEAISHSLCGNQLTPCLIPGQDQGYRGSPPAVVKIRVQAPATNVSSNGGTRTEKYQSDLLAFSLLNKVSQFQFATIIQLCRWVMTTSDFTKITQANQRNPDRYEWVHWIDWINEAYPLIHIYFFVPWSCDPSPLIKMWWSVWWLHTGDYEHKNGSKNVKVCTHIGLLKFVSLPQVCWIWLMKQIQITIQPIKVCWHL